MKANLFLNNKKLCGKESIINQKNISVSRITVSLD